MTGADDSSEVGGAEGDEENAPLGASEGNVVIPPGVFLKQVVTGAFSTRVFSMSAHLASFGRVNHSVNASGATVNGPPKVLFSPADFQSAP